MKPTLFVSLLAPLAALRGAPPAPAQEGAPGWLPMDTIELPAIFKSRATNGAISS